ncbi:hypothetical protein [Burkholderia sp. Ac-20353]|uniref:hypothetical protein n=1 Tax=Burkholderia sp. Ac-20353 TaxID=2703894 RepID=UPI00197C4C9B|nr:hypothetical protein [Burkholderia sp. Ac-20353]MBN3788316.1 hypothetical protein [Burkholderia sp. Ac-20353]
MDKPQTLTAGCKPTATFIGYCEWRPTRYRVKDSTGRNYGLFTSHAKAVIFADGVLASLDENENDVYVTIKAERDANFFVWDGDNIGLGDGPATVILHDEFGSQLLRSVRQILAMASMIDARGMTRIVSALRHFGDTGELHPDDLAAWQEVKDDLPVFTRGEVL